MKNFADRLSCLFDYQRFEKNKELQRIINDVENRYDSGAVLLMESELSFAAGGKDVERQIKDKNKTDEQSFNGQNL